MQLTNARRRARTDETGQMVSLENQDRTLWDHEVIQSASDLLVEQFKLGQLGPYQLQAAISGLHCKANNWQATDWPQITSLYQTLAKFDPSPVVRLNAAMAQANMGQVELALAQLLHLEDDLGTYQPFYAARAEMHLMLKDRNAARADMQKAIELTSNQVEKQFLLNKLNQLN